MPYKRINARIPEDIYDEMVLSAGKENLNLSEFVIQCIQNSLYEKINLPARMEKVEDDLKEILWNISLLSNYQMEMSKLLFTRLPRGGAVMDEQARQRYFQSVEDVQKLASRSVAGVMEMKDIWGLEEGSEGENK